MLFKLKMLMGLSASIREMDHKQNSKSEVLLMVRQRDIQVVI